MSDLDTEERQKRTCNTCQHFTMETFSTRCEHISLCHLSGDPGVSARALRWVQVYSDKTGSTKDADEDCPLHVLSDELVVAEYREAHGFCKYCAWPLGCCKHL